MAYNERIEQRIDKIVKRWQGMGKKKMFGGICYLIHGNMCFGIHKDSLVVRAGVEAAEERMTEKYVRPFDITGRPMKGWVMVEEGGWEADESLKGWLALGKKFALTLPKK